MNTAAPIPASTFTISSVQHFAATADSDGTVPLLVYAGDSERTAREHIADAYENDHGIDQQDRADAERWLREYLSENPGAKSVEAKREAKKDAGIPERTLQRAAKNIGVIVGYVGMPAVSVWSLANDAAQSDSNGRVVAPLAPVSRGVSGATGVSPGHTVTPSCATSEDGATVAQQHHQQELPVAPDMPDTHGPAAQQPPGGLTEHTPGQTDRVQQALAKARTGESDKPVLCCECRNPIPASLRSAQARGICTRCVANNGTGAEGVR
jgi:hypothetical protein